MFDIILFEPEIPPNTGNIIRLCANTGMRLHLVEPLGFRLDDARLRRAGLDYHEYAPVKVHRGWAFCQEALQGRRCFAVTTRGGMRYADCAFRPGDAFVFGPETRGLPDDVLAEFAEDRRIRLPMLPGSRSLNLANAVAVVVYEAWRQQAFSQGR
ncbi:MAG: tRNA (cytidine(34)-2'-O)-methyltransferase [Betaproteobacteria bacterium]|nr:tRNA (cytidine(34)-2'-O)-methyltransferase [Betaproteobacteria bacterium]